jgi:putative Mg2+ transporter-C (MgtC) family protein
MEIRKERSANRARERKGVLHTPPANLNEPEDRGWISAVGGRWSVVGGRRVWHAECSGGGIAGEKGARHMEETIDLTVEQMLIRLVVAAVIGGMIGYERRLHHKAIGVAGMMLVSVGSATYMLLAKHLQEADPAALSRALQGILQGIGFLGGAVIFKTGTDVHGIKTAAAIWIAGAIGLAIGTWFWWLGVIVGVATATILFISDLIPTTQRQGDDQERGRGRQDDKMTR